MVLNKNEMKTQFEELVEKYDSDDQLRDKIIGITRTITKLAKQSIYATHRHELEDAKKLIDEAENELEKANKIISSAGMYLMNTLRSAIEEYVEAKAFYEYITEKKLILIKNLKFEIPYETYMEALCDFTGELAKFSVTLATNNDLEGVKEIKETIEEIYGFFLKFDFRSSELRRKFDSLKYNLNKLETIIYDLGLKLK